MKVGRNDPCPCGSGKLFKHCHGKENVIFVEQVLLEDLEQICFQILEFAVERYTIHLQRGLGRFLQNCPEVFIPEELLEVLFTCHFISYEKLPTGKTIMETFIHQETKNVHRPRIQSIVRTWKSPVPVFGISRKQSERTFIIDDVLSGTSYFVHSKYPMEDGGIHLQILLPYKNEEYILFYPPVGFVPERKDAIVQLVQKQIKDLQYKRTVHFLQDRFLFIVNDIFRFIESLIEKEEMDHREAYETLSVEEVIDSIHFEKEIYEIVAYMLIDELTFHHVNEQDIKIALFCWGFYCREKAPIIRKPGIYLAALLYNLQAMWLLDTNYTYKELAEEYEVSASSIAKVANDIFDYINEEIDLIEQHAGDWQEYDYDDAEMMERCLHSGSFFLDQEAIQHDEGREKSIPDFNTGQTNDHKKKEWAEALVYSAFEKSGPERLRLAIEALKIYPNLPDAYIILSEFAKDETQALHLLQKAVQVGEEELQDFLNHPDGYLWLHVEARPYLRAKHQLAMLLERLGFDLNAIRHLEEILTLNEMDNQGARYSLLTLYIRNRLYKKAHYLLQKYDEASALFAYGKFFLELAENGLTDLARILWENAKEANRYLAAYLVKQDTIPQKIVQNYSLGSEEEALIFIHELLKIFDKNPTVSHRFSQFIETIK